MGIGLGVTIHVSDTLLGVGLLIRQSLWLFNAVKLVGAIYLIYLGAKMLAARPADARPTTQAVPLSDLAALRTGFLTNVLNPKTTVFIVSLFMQAVRPDTPLVIQIGLACSSRWRMQAGSAWWPSVSPPMPSAIVCYPYVTGPTAPSASCSSASA